MGLGGMMALALIGPLPNGVAVWPLPLLLLGAGILGQGFAPEAEDVAQDVMLRVHHSLASFRGESAFGSWVYRIAFNQALNVKVRMRYRAPHLGEEALATAPARGPARHELLHARARRNAVQASIAELPEVYQAALRLYYWLGVGIAGKSPSRSTCPRTR
jgi:RNA polymerase sigma-70 factor (ECF subfamily)